MLLSWRHPTPPPRPPPACASTSSPGRERGGPGGSPARAPRPGAAPHGGGGRAGRPGPGAPGPTDEEDEDPQGGQAASASLLSLSFQQAAHCPLSRFYSCRTLGLHRPGPAGRGWGSARPPLPLPAGAAGRASVCLAAWGQVPLGDPSRVQVHPRGAARGRGAPPSPVGRLGRREPPHAAGPAPVPWGLSHACTGGLLSPATLPGTHRSPAPGPGAPDVGRRACAVAPGGH